MNAQLTKFKGDNFKLQVHVSVHYHQHITWTRNFKADSSVATNIVKRDLLFQFPAKHTSHMRYNGAKQEPQISEDSQVG